jgi:hypothetical protein
VFTVDWNQPAPDGSSKPLIPNEVVHALVQHFDEHDLSNRGVPSDVLGRAYEYLIKQFALLATDLPLSPVIRRRQPQTRGKRRRWAERWDGDNTAFRRRGWADARTGESGSVPWARWARRSF